MRTDFILSQELGYFENNGIEVMAFDDIYPEGHQSGVSVIMYGKRIATNGDIRFEQTPGQWQAVPKQGERVLNTEENSITTNLSYPDESRHLRGFNPMIYPDFRFNYTVKAVAEGDAVRVTVDLDKPVPEEFLGKINFNLELFPGELFGKPWLMDDYSGIFPHQANGPTKTQKANYSQTGDFALDDAMADIALLSGDNKSYNPIIADDIIGEPYASGYKFVMRPDDPLQCCTIESKKAKIKLYDGRMNHNNGWFTLCSEVPAGTTKGAIEWVIRPNQVQGWLHTPVVQTSQVGYHPGQPKVAIIELDKRDVERQEISLYKITADGPLLVTKKVGEEWGRFLRYNYVKFDFTSIKEEGLYKVEYGSSMSSVFRIASDVYDRGVWQPVLEYFLPVQMCHMRVNEKYRVWHGLCHDDDAIMAPVNLNHIDGYVQGDSTLCKYKSGEHVPGLNVGGWHDAGDFDLRVESQAGEAYILAMAYEAFGVDYDETTICQDKKLVEIHQPDGKNDILQQVEHGVLSVVAAYRALGRLYRGIIERDLRQYVLLGDSANLTNNIVETGAKSDDRWVFTEDNPPRELSTAAQLAACARVLKGFNDELAGHSLDAARELFDVTKVTDNARIPKIHAAVELYLSTNEDKYKEFLLGEVEFITANIGQIGWFIARAGQKMADANFTAAIRAVLPALRDSYITQAAETPYGIPYRPHIWGAGWNIQRIGYEYYYLHTAYPDIFAPEMIYDALNFVLGCHPGSNTSSFASGVGAVNATVGYGLNRADWSFIPGGVVSGTALIRPDFPELLVFPYLWQQVEYVMGGGSSHYMFLVLAAQQCCRA